MFNGQENGMKGQHNLAQGNPGKTGRRPGLEWRKQNCPRNNVHKRENLISDKTKDLVFPGNNVLQIRFADFVNSIPSEGNYLLCSTNPHGRFLSCVLYPGRRFGSFLPKLYPGLLYSGLSGRKNILTATCV